MYELYLGTAEKVSDRRAQANSWMLNVNSGIVALQGFLQSVSAALPVAGLIICVAWAALLKSYREINRAKFAVLSGSRSSRITNRLSRASTTIVTFELRFEEGYEEAREWLQDAATQDELDSLCLSAREAKNEAA
jgi:hypothetical protein